MACRCVKRVKRASIDGGGARLQECESKEMLVERQAEAGHFWTRPKQYPVTSHAVTSGALRILSLVSLNRVGVTIDLGYCFCISYYMYSLERLCSSSG